MHHFTTIIYWMILSFDVRASNITIPLAAISEAYKGIKCDPARGTIHELSLLNPFSRSDATAQRMNYS